MNLDDIHGAREAFEQALALRRTLGDAEASRLKAHACWCTPYIAGLLPGRHQSPCLEQWVGWNRGGQSWILSRRLLPSTASSSICDAAAFSCQSFSTLWQSFLETLFLISRVRPMGSMQETFWPK